MWDKPAIGTLGLSEWSEEAHCGYIHILAHTYDERDETMKVRKENSIRKE